MRPTIICLCGSSRFVEHMAIMAWNLEKGGPLSWGSSYYRHGIQG